MSSNERPTAEQLGEIRLEHHYAGADAAGPPISAYHHERRGLLLAEIDAMAAELAALRTEPAAVDLSGALRSYIRDGVPLAEATKREVEKR